MNIQQQLIQFLEASSVSLYRLSKETHIPLSCLSRLKNGQQKSVVSERADIIRACMATLDKEAAKSVGVFYPQNEGDHE